ncbi:MAG: hypothetical protein AAF205_02365 [Pseudomonadota bacterium]
MSFVADLRRRWHAARLERRAQPRKPLPGPLATLPRWAVAILGIALFAILYWGLLGAIMGTTQTDLALRPGPEALPPGGSVTVGTLAALGEAEVDRGAWTPNNLLLHPTSFRDDMPALQTGILTTMTAAGGALETLGDDDLMAAAEALDVDAARSFFHADFPFIGGSAGARILSASDHYEAFNTRLAAGEADRPGGAAVARRLVTAIGAPLVADARAFDRAILDRAPDAGEDADGDMALSYQRVRGKAYAAALLLRGVQTDFEPVLRERGLSGTLIEALEALDRIAGADPVFIGDNDRTEQGYLTRSAVTTLSRLRTGLE